MKRAPLLLSVALTTSAAVGAIIGTFVPAWGLALAFPVGITVIAVGTWRNPDDETLPAVLAGALAVSLGYGVATIAVTSNSLAHAPNPQRFFELLEVSDIGAARVALWKRWATMLLGIPIATLTLVRRWRRAGR